MSNGPKETNKSIEFTIESANRKWFDWKEIWQYRELFYFFTWRDLKVKYKQTTLGIAWVILQPITTVVVFSLFFGRALKVPSDQLPYPVFVFSGLLFWMFFSNSVSNAGNSMLSQASIIKKIYFPRLIIPVSVILGSLVDFFVAFVLFVVVMLFYQVPVDFLEVLVYWPIALLLTLAGTLGISCWLAALVVKYRDFRYIVPFGLQLLLFLTPIIYPSTIIGNNWVKLTLALNPMHGAITLFRMPFYSSSDQALGIMISAVSSLACFSIGVYYFKKTEDLFADLA